MSKTFLITWQWPDSIDRRVEQLGVPDDTFTEKARVLISEDADDSLIAKRELRGCILCLRDWRAPVPPHELCPLCNEGAEIMNPTTSLGRYEPVDVVKTCEQFDKKGIRDPTHTHTSINC